MRIQNCDIYFISAQSMSENFVPLVDKLNKIKSETDDQIEKDLIDCLLSTEVLYAIIGTYITKGRGIKGQDTIDNLKKHGFSK